MTLTPALLISLWVTLCLTELCYGDIICSERHRLPVLTSEWPKPKMWQHLMVPESWNTLLGRVSDFSGVAEAPRKGRRRG